jgi:mechanosensitive ion channel-like protein
MNDLGTTISGGAAAAWASVILWGPKLLMFIAILVIGYFVAKLICKVLNRVLEKVGFDRLVERGGIKRALDRSNWDASDILSKLAFYFVMLFTLQLAFGVFGPNPVSQMLTAVIAYLPNVFAALIIVVIAGAIAAGVKQMVQAAIGGLRYGRMLGTIASVAVMFVGIFAALNQLNIAPAIVNGLFYAALVVVAGSATIAIGGGGIMPMRRVWDRMLNRMEQEAPRLKQEAAGAGERIKERAEEMKEKTKYEYAHAKGDHHEEGEHETPRFKT